MNTFAIFSSLIGVRETVEKSLELPDSKNPDDRRAVIRAIGELLEKYIVPLSDEYDKSDKTIDFLKIQEVTDGKIDGLVSGIFDEEIKERITGLENPGDDAVKEALDFVDASFDNQEKRAFIFRCPAGIQANYSIRSLIYFLEEPFIDSEKHNIKGLETERKLIKNFTEKNISARLRDILRSLLEKIS